MQVRIDIVRLERLSMFSDKVVDVFGPFRQNDVVYSNLFVALQVAQVEVVRIDLKWIINTNFVEMFS